MALTLKVDSLVLTNSLFPCLTNSGTKAIRITKMQFCCGGTGGTITAQLRNNSQNPADHYLLYNTPIAANGVYEMFDLVLEAGDSLRVAQTGADFVHLNTFYVLDT